MLGNKPEPPFELLKRDVSTEVALKTVFPEAQFTIGIREDESVNILVTLQIYSATDYNQWEDLPPATKASMVDIVHQELLHYMQEYIDRYVC